MLTQAIQGHITHTRNQPTLGLAVKLQHRHRSSELIKLLHDHGFIVSYDEVFRLKKSATKLVCDIDRSSILHQAMGLSRRVGPIFGWFDNLDLLQCINPKWTPRQPITDPCHGSRVPAAPIRHPRNWKWSTWINEPCDPTPTAVCFTIFQNQHQQVCSSSVHGAEKCARNESLGSCSVEGHQVAEFRCHLITACSGMDTTTSLLEINPVLIMPATVYLFGPLIDAPPSHPDTVLTTLLYMDTSLGELGMTCANLCIGMQLYMVGQQVKWWEPDRFKDVILRPGAMHIIMSFLGCIGTLMKGSGPDTLVGSGIGGLTLLTGVERWKPWGHSVWYPLHDWRFFCRPWPMRTILMISWHTLKMGGNTHQGYYGWITFWCQRSRLISFFGQRERKTGSSNWRCQGRPHWRSTCLPP